MGNTLEHLERFKVEMESQSCTPIKNFQFHDSFPVEESNGLTLKNVYVPEEVLLYILSLIEPKNVLKYSLVCRRWCNIIKSNQFWRDMYKKATYDKNPGDYPWYVYYNYLTTSNFINLLQNPNGANGFHNWSIVKGGDGIKIECPPIGCDPLPKEPEFESDNHCFVTSFMQCSMMQTIDITKKRLLRYILKEYKLPLYISDWTAGRFDCSSTYTLATRVESIEVGEKPVASTHQIREESLLDPFDRVKWKKIDLLFEEYPDDLAKIFFQRSGKDKQFWAGNYGSKFSGGTVKFLLKKSVDKK